MMVTLLKSKIHRATVTQSELDYFGSITLDENLMEAAGLLENEQVHVLNVNNGARLVTYVIRGEPGSGTVCLNGPSARQVVPGDIVIVVSYASMTPEEAAGFKPRVIFVDGKNRPARKPGRSRDLPSNGGVVPPGSADDAPSGRRRPNAATGGRESGLS